MSSSEWVLFTDADVHFGAGLLRRAIDVGVARSVEHVTLLPRLIARGVLLESLIAAFGAAFVSSTKAHRVNRPKQVGFIGLGAFNLVKRAALERSEGFAWLKLEIGDAMALGAVLQRAGVRTFFAVADEGLEIEWYSSLADMVRGLEKNLYAIGCRLSPVRLAVMSFTILSCYAGPIWAVVDGGHLWLTLLGALGLSGIAVYYTLAGRMARAGWAASLLSPLTSLVLVFTIWRSAFYCLLRGGVMWGARSTQRGSFAPGNASSSEARGSAS